MAKSIIIIGSGMGGLASGIYARMNGYDVRIFEMHTHPGGQCASWTRQGYTFDACIHHLMGCKPGSRINSLWRELGAMPRDMAAQDELVAVSDASGKVFYDYTDPQKLKEHMLKIAPEDADEIEKYVSAIQSFADTDLMGRMVLGGKASLIAVLPKIFRNMKYMTTPLGNYAKRFKSPFLRRAIPLLEYSIPDIPAGVHFIKHAAATSGDIKWPIGASRSFASSVVKKYEDLGGELILGKRVKKILTQGNRAVGVRLEDGSEYFADTVISNADGRKTIFDMLDGHFKNEEIEAWAKYGENDETNWGTMVYLGVNRDFSKEPSSLVMLLDEPVSLTGIHADSLEMQIYGFDPSMAPEGKGVIKAEMVTGYSYWSGCTPEEYEQKKQEVAGQVIEVLEKRFPGITSQVEVIDVVTIKTWERFMGGTRGFANMPAKPFGFSAMLGRQKTTLPGLNRFFMTGVWVSGTGALFANAFTGKTVIKQICKRDGRKFEVK